MQRVNRDRYADAGQTQSVKEIGERIVALRRAMGLSQPALARLVGIKQPSLHAIESGKTKKLRGDTLAGLCRALNVSPDTLLGHRGPSTEESLLHESEMVAIWRSLTPQDRDHLLAIARALAGRMVPRAADRTGRGPSTTQSGKLTQQ